MGTCWSHFTSPGVPYAAGGLSEACRCFQGWQLRFVPVWGACATDVQASLRWAPTPTRLLVCCAVWRCAWSSGCGRKSLGVCCCLRSHPRPTGGSVKRYDVWTCVGHTGVLPLNVFSAESQTLQRCHLKRMLFIYMHAAHRESLCWLPCAADYAVC